MPDYADAYYNRAEIFSDQENHGAAIAGFQKYLDLGGGVRDGDQEDVEQRIRDLKKSLNNQKNKSEFVRKFIAIAQQS